MTITFGATARKVIVLQQMAHPLTTRPCGIDVGDCEFVLRSNVASSGEHQAPSCRNRASHIGAAIVVEERRRRVQAMGKALAMLRCATVTAAWRVLCPWPVPDGVVQAKGKALAMLRCATVTASVIVLTAEQ